VPHGPELPVLNPPQGNANGVDSNCSKCADNFEDPIYSAEGRTNENKPYYSNQKDLNDFIKDLSTFQSPILSSKHPD